MSNSNLWRIIREKKEKFGGRIRVALGMCGGPMYNGPIFFFPRSHTSLRIRAQTGSSLTVLPHLQPTFPQILQAHNLASKGPLFHTNGTREE